MKGFKKHILDFEIVPTGNSKTIVFVDSSQYRSIPERPLLEVILPGYKKYFLVNVIAGRINTFNSNTIGLTHLLNGDCLVDLPDGIYTFKYKICPYNLTYIIKQFFRTTLIEKKLTKLYERWDGSTIVKDNILIRDLAEVHALIEGAKLLANKDEKKANEFYQTANKLIDRIIKNLDKNCC